MANSNTLTVYSASAGTGKTYTLASRYIALLIDHDDPYLFRHILAVTFTNKATAEMKRRILSYLYIIAESDINDKGRAQFIQNVSLFLDNKQINVINGVEQVVEMAKKGKSLKKRTIKTWSLRDKARTLYRNILWEYQNMRVTTIDSFLQALLVGMARKIGIGADFAVELDLGHVISTAVDQVMQLQTADTSDTRSPSPDSKYSLRQILTDYVNEQLNDEKKWDVRKNLISMTKELLKEAVLREDNTIEYNPKRLDAIKRNLNWKKAQCINQMRAAWEKVKDCEDHKEIDKGRNFYFFIKRVGDSLNGDKDLDDMFKPLGKRDEKTLNNDGVITKVAPATDNPARAQIVSDTLQEMQWLCPHCREEYLKWKVFGKFLSDLKVMKFVQDTIKENLNEANCVLQARTADVLSKALKPGDADFILEKAGIRYQYLMIDEFQDTSATQWEIFRQLMTEILSQGGYALVVGDIKQSIYRWRNGDYRIMKDLLDPADAQKKGTANNNQSASAALPYKVEREYLERNFRSEPVVVDFNLSLFNNLIQEGAFAEDSADIYKEGEEGYKKENLKNYHNKKDNNSGYVEIDVWGCASKGNKDEAQKLLSLKNVKEQAVEHMFNTIDDLINDGMQPADILILVRKNKEAMLIADKFAQIKLTQPNIRLINSDSFRLDSSPSVLAVINALKYIHHRDDIAKEYLLMQGYSLDLINNLRKDLPLNELAEAVVRRLLCDKAGQINQDVSDISYLNCLMDEIHNYVTRYGSDLKGLLDYWEDSLQTKTIPATGNDGIRLMTIHTAKGLEGKTVFLPFCSWPLIESDTHHPTLWIEEPTSITKDTMSKESRLIPVEATSYLDEIKGVLKSNDENKYQEEVTANHVDNLNLLYVALTRAEANLYIYTYVNKNTDLANPKDVGEILLSGLDNTNWPKTGKELIEDIDKEIETWTNKKKVNTPANEAPTLQEGESLPRIETHLGTLLIEQKSGKGLQTPFEYTYDNKDYKPYSYHTADNSFRFRQSQEAMLWMMQKQENAQEAMERIQEGNIRHDIFAHIATVKDTDKAIDYFLRRGLIDSAQAEEIKAELLRAWENPQMKDWFSGDWQLLREVSIMRPETEYQQEMEMWRQLSEEKRGPMPKRELRPDRVMIKGSKAVVLDFKFGKHHQNIDAEQAQIDTKQTVSDAKQAQNDTMQAEAYAKQVRSYMLLLKEMGYQQIEGWLWYGRSGELVEVPPQ